VDWTDKPVSCAWTSLLDKAQGRCWAALKLKLKLIDNRWPGSPWEDKLTRTSLEEFKQQDRIQGGMDLKREKTKKPISIIVWVAIDPSLPLYWLWRHLCDLLKAHFSCHGNQPKHYSERLVET
jgi:hypothetical protein